VECELICEDEEIRSLVPVRIYGHYRLVIYICPLLLGLVTILTVGRFLYALLMHIK